MGCVWRWQVIVCLASTAANNRLSLTCLTPRGRRGAQAASAQVRLLLLHVLHALLADPLHRLRVAAAGVRAACLRAGVSRLLPLQRRVGCVL